MGGDRRVLRTLVALTALLSACGGGAGLAEKANAPQPSAQVAETAARSTEQATPTTNPATTLPVTTLPASTLPATTLPVTTLPVTTVAAAALPVSTPAVVVPAVVLPAALPVPLDPPADDQGEEPVIELGSIEIPRIGLDAALYEGIRLSTLDRGPGHWPGTAMPGEVGNVVVAGHRTSYSRPFRYLDLLEPGDEVIFNTVDGRFVYTVVGTEIVTPDAIRIIDQTPERTATLFACHPVGSTRQRIVVHLALAGS